MSAATRTYQFDQRLPDPATLGAMSGLEYLLGVLRGVHPAAPIAATLGFTAVEFGPGRAVFEGEPQRFLYNPLGTVHGGWFATLLDSAMGCAVHSTLPVGKGYTTVELSVHLVRALTERTRKVRCTGQIVHAGGSMATAEGKILDEDGTLYAHGTTTCLVLTPR